jgi:hypothetical protein
MTFEKDRKTIPSNEARSDGVFESPLPWLFDNSMQAAALTTE